MLFFFIYFSDFSSKFVSCFLWNYRLTLVNICRMSDCIIGLRLGVLTPTLLFYLFFFHSLFSMFTLKSCVRVFSGSIGTRI